MNTVQVAERASQAKPFESCSNWNVGPEWGEFVNGASAFVYKLTPTIYEVLFGLKSMSIEKVIDGIKNGGGLIDGESVLVEINPTLGLVISEPSRTVSQARKRDAIEAVESYEEDFREFMSGPATNVIAGSDFAELPEVEF